MDERIKTGLYLDSQTPGMVVSLDTDADSPSAHEEKANNRCFFGMPLDTAPIEPPVESFRYPHDELCKAPPPTDNLVVPPASADPPPDATYPKAQPMTLCRDTRYQRGYVYAASHDTTKQAMLRAHLMSVVVPPGVQPDRQEDGSYVSRPIPGMIKMVPGIPYIYHINGNHDHIMTIGCAQTLESLQHYPDFPDILDASVRLAKLSWGCAAHGDTPTIPPLYTLGLKRNDRSGNTDGERPYDGSYSLATTIIKGEGQGSVAPAVQVNTDSAAAQIRSVLKTLHQLCGLIMPKCISRFEREILAFHSEINNVVAFGGLEPGATSCQLNVSSLGDHLTKYMGKDQGGIHTDSHDDRTRMTMVVALLRGGPTGDPGPFSLIRSGLYVREAGIWIIFLVFKGVDLHSGYAPSEDKDAHAAWIDSELAPAWNRAGEQNRLAFVCYPASAATQRSAAMNMTPSQTFGNFAAAQPHKKSQTTFATHGQVALGDKEAWANRLGREMVFGLWNQLQHCNLDLDLRPNELLQQISFTNSDGERIPLKPFAYDPVQDFKKIKLWNGYYKWYQLQCDMMHINIVKHQFVKRRQIRNAAYEAENEQTVFHSSERRSIASKQAQQLIAPSDGCDAASPTPVSIDVDKVLGRKVIDRKTLYTVIISSTGETREVDESLLEGNLKLFTYLAEHVPSSMISKANAFTVSSTASHQTTAKVLPDSEDVSLPVQEDAHSIAPLPSTSGASHADIIITTQLDPDANALTDTPLAQEGVQATALSSTTNGKPTSPLPTTSRTSNMVAISGTSKEDAQATTSSLASGRPARNVSGPGGTDPIPSPSSALEDDQSAAPTPTTTARKTKTTTSHSGTGNRPKVKKKRKNINDEDFQDDSETRSQGKPKRVKRPFNRRDNNEDNFDVEAIVDFEQEPGEAPRWLVKWEGYDDSENTWESEECLLGCIQLLADYNKKHNITVRGLTETANHNKGTSPSQTKTKFHLPEVDGPVKLSGNLAKLEDLLNIDNLRTELEGLKDVHLEAPPARYYTHHADITHTIGALVEQGREHNALDSLVSALSAQDPSMGGLLFKRLLHSVKIIPQCASDLRKLDIISRATLWEMCRSLVIVFSWHTQDGPATAQKLMQTHRLSGYKALKEEAPAFADLVDHVVQYVYALQNLAVDQKRSKRRKVPTPGKPARKPYTPTTPTESTPEFGPTPPVLFELPADLYGLLDGVTSKKSIPMPRLTKLKGGLEELYERSAACLQEIWTHNIIIPQLREIDKGLNYKRTKFTDQHIWERSITRGAVLGTIAQACGTDAIFAFLAIMLYLPSPALLFQENLAKDSKFCKRVINDTLNVLKPLSDFIVQRVKEQPGIFEVVSELGDLVHREVVALKYKGHAPTDIVRSTEGHDTGHAAKERPKAQKSKSSKPHIPVTCDTLLPHADRPTPQVSLVALIVREALNLHRKLPAGDERLRRILLGEHAVHSSPSSRNPDHTNPIRKSMVGLALLKHHLPPDQLTSKWGLSNLLCWMGTGQGYATQDFLKQITDRERFFSTDPHAIVANFETAMKANARLVSSYAQGGGRPVKDTPGVNAAYDMSIWGQPNNLLSATPTLVGQNGRKLTLKEKMLPYFSDKVVNAWKTWLGDLLDCDPATYKGPLRPWHSALKLANDLGLPGFGPGLTQLQFANNLVLLGLAEAPKPHEMGIWIYAHKGLGAYGGLEYLGFSVWDEASTNAAFMCIYQHLADHLTDDDKEIMGFNPIFVEHLLCKVTRWASFLWKDAKIKFDELGRELTTDLDETWIRGGNVSNAQGYPIPLQMSPERLGQIIEAAADFLA